MIIRPDRPDFTSRRQKQCFRIVNYTIFDYELDVARSLDVIERIAADHHKVGEFSRFN